MVEFSRGRADGSRIIPEAWDGVKDAVSDKVSGMGGGRIGEAVDSVKYGAGKTVGIGDSLAVPFKKTSAAIKKGAGKSIKMLGIATILTALPLALAYFSASTRSNRRAAGERELDHLKSSSQFEMPPVLTGQDFMPQVPQPETMMGMTPTPGDMARRVRGGFGGGINPTAPSSEKFGKSVIDGKPVEDLGSPAQLGA